VCGGSPRFHSEVRALHALAAGTGIHFIQFANMLDDAAAGPAFDPEMVQATFYERAQTPVEVSSRCGPLRWLGLSEQLNALVRWSLCRVHAAARSGSLK
jgi:hypothetical protein